MKPEPQPNPQPEPTEPKWDAANPTESFRRHADFLHQKARWMFLKDKTHVEIMFVFQSNGEGTVILVRGDRDAFVENLKKMIRDNDIIGVVHICEAWTRNAGKKDHVTKQIMLGEIRVSDLRPDDKGEALFTSIQSKDGQSSCWVDPIVRDATGVVSFREGFNLGKTSGRFGGLFE